MNTSAVKQGLPSRAIHSLYLVLLMLPAAICSGKELASNYTAAPLVELNDNGAWSWFMDERAIIVGDHLLVGSVRAVRDFKAGADDPNWGNVEIAVWNTRSGERAVRVLHPHLEQDDHNAPALLALPDGRILAVYSRHGQDTKVYHAHTSPDDPLSWSTPVEFVTPGKAESFGGDSVTYSNLFRRDDGRIINFFRGVGHDPNYMVSDDNAESWTYGGRLMRGRDGYSPYLKYVADATGTIHFVATEDHPRNFDNSLYHGQIRGDDLLLSDGSVNGTLSHDTSTSLSTWDFTRVFQGGSDNVAWMTDIEVDSNDRPVVLFSVQKDGRGLPARQGGMDHRFNLARWNGQRWQSEEIAFAGSRLYPYEDDYTGLGAIVPADTSKIFISTNAHPATGAPLISCADNQRHYELFEGQRDEATGKWDWQPFTANSTVDNLRPLVPRQGDSSAVIVWMRGRYHHNRGAWTTKVVGAKVPVSRPQ